MTTTRQSITMTEPTADEFVFECLDCGERFEVNSGMREAILTHGCPVCGASVTDDAFTSKASS